MRIISITSCPLLLTDLSWSRSTKSNTLYVRVISITNENVNTFYELFSILLNGLSSLYLISNFDSNYNLFD